MPTCRARGQVFEVVGDRLSRLISTDRASVEGHSNRTRILINRNSFLNDMHPAN